MTTDQLKTEIEVSAWREVTIKTGQTNGQDVLHVIDPHARKSRTIRGLGEWMTHPLNPRNRPQKKRQDNDEQGLQQ